MRTSHARMSDEQLEFVVEQTRELIRLLELKLDLQKRLLAEAEIELDARAAASPACPYAA